MEHKVKMNAYELTEIWEYFITRNSQYNAEKSNKPESVMPRRAFVNSVNRYTTYPEIAECLGIDRATSYHYRKTHDGNMIYQDYRDLYSDAVLCVNKFIKGDLMDADTAIYEDLQKLRDEVAFLRGKLLKLKEIVGKQVELFVD